MSRVVDAGGARPRSPSGIGGALLLAGLLALPGLLGAQAADEPKGPERSPGSPARPAERAPTDDEAGSARPSDAELETAVGKAVEFLLSNQEEDGTVGHWRRSIGSDNWHWTDAGSHFAWQLATTGIACVAWMDLGPRRTEETDAALGRALDAIVRHAPDRKRISNWDVDNTWGYLYGLEAVARALADPSVVGTEREGPLRETARVLFEKTLAHQCPDGGWSYYDDPPYTARPTWSTSFVTASFLLVFEQLERVGIEVPDRVEARAVRALEHCRLPNGAYAYSVEPVPSVGRLTGINQVKGSLCRIQVGNLALHRRDAGEVGAEDLVAGLEKFFRHHRFIALARGRPFPHEAYYANSGYFFFYGHYYAAGVIEELPLDQQGRWWDALTEKVIATQEADGSMWDYQMQSYSRPYATAWSVSILCKALAARARD